MGKNQAPEHRFGCTRSPIKHHGGWKYRGASGQLLCLGSTQSSNGGSQAENASHSLASSVMSSLQQVWKDGYLSLPTKIRVYKILVLPVLPYACETWTILAADERRLEAFHMKCQRQITEIRWQDHIRDYEVAARTSLGPVSDLTRRRNSVFGHMPGFLETRQPTKHSCVMSIWLSAIFPTKAGSVAQVVPTTDGLIRYAGTTTKRHQLTCG